MITAAKLTGLAAVVVTVALAGWLYGIAAATFTVLAAAGAFLFAAADVADGDTTIPGRGTAASRSK